MHLHSVQFELDPVGFLVCVGCHIHESNTSCAQTHCGRTHGGYADRISLELSEHKIMSTPGALQVGNRPAQQYPLKVKFGFLHSLA